MATINHGSGADIIVPSNNGTTYRGLAGDDTYIISNSIAANATVTIVDTSGANKIQLVDGLSVASSKFAADAVQLTLSNGAVVTINGASNFTYDVGGNATTGTAGSSNTLSQFASAMGVATLPTSGSTDGSSDISIANNGVSGSAAPTFTVSKDLTSVDEGGSVTFTITASSAVSADTSFSWSVIGDNNGNTIDKAGTADVDVLSGSETIAAGSTSTTFSVTAASDAVVEGIEGIKVSVFDANATALSSDIILVNNTGSSATSQGFTLTTGVNEMTGGSGNDSFDGSTDDSLNDFDVLDGAGGTDTLTFSTANHATSAVTFIPQLSNIEVIQVTAKDADATASDDIVTVQLSGISGLTKLANIASAEDVVFDTVGNLVDLDLKSPKEDTTLTFADAALAGAADEITVTLKGTQTNTSLVINDAGVIPNSLETVHLKSLAVANSLDHNFSGVAPSTIKISGDKRLTLEDTTDTTVITVDASASTGGVSLAGTGYANATIHGGSGADVITAAPTGMANLSLGGGNDTVDFDGTLNALDVVDGGDGTDTITMSSGFTQTSVLGGVSNIEVIALDADAQTITLEANIGPTTFNFSQDDDQILNLNDGYTNDTTVVITGDDTNADKIVNTAGVTLNVIGNAEDFDGDVNTTITGGVGTDTLTIRNFADAAEAEIAANITGIDKIVYVDVTAGADTTLTIGAYTLSATAALALTIDASELDGGVAPEIFTLAGASSVTRMDVTGGGAGDVITLGTLADTVDGGAGADSITGTAGSNVITGGAGNDTVVAGTGAENINTGDGNDYLNVAGNLNSGDTIDGGAGTDTMTMSSGISTASVMGGVSNIEVLAVTGAVTVVANGSLGGANTFDFSAEANQVLTLTSAAAGGTYTGDTTVMLTNLAAGTTDATGADTITNSKDVTLNVIGNAASFDAGVTITGGATAVDTLTIIADGADAILSGTSYMNKVVIQDSATQGTDVEITPDPADATTPALEIDGTALDAGAGSADETLTLDGDSVTLTVLTATGGKGADTLLGGAANDVLSGGAGADQLNGNGGVDNLSGGAANDTFVVDSVGETYSATYGATTMDGGAGTDTVAFQSAQTHTAATLAGISNTEVWTLPQDSNFTISDAVLTANPGLSIRIAGNGTLSGGEDTAGGALMTSAINVTSTAAGNLNLIGSSADDTFTFYATESLTADDTIDGNAGSDTIYIVNDDNLNGVGDTTTATFGANTKGIEKIVITDASADDSLGDVTITINNGYLDTALTVDGSQQDMNSITLTNEERLTLTSNDVNVALTVLGGAGADSITTNAGLDHITGGGGADSIASGDGADTIYGGDGVDAIRGEGGTDYIEAGAGNDVITVDDFSDFQTSGGVETVKGGAGTDTLSFTEAVALDLSAPELEHLYGIEVISLDRAVDTSSKITLGNATFTNLGSSVLTIVGSDHAGDDADNEIDASAVTNGSIVVTGNPRTGVDDTIKGGSGDDIFRFSGTANLQDGDILDGNGGSDTIQLNASAAAVTATIDFDDVTDMETLSVTKLTALTDGGDVTVVIDDNDVLTLAQERALSLEVDATAMNTNNFIFNNANHDDVGMALTITGGGKNDTIAGSGGHDTISGGSYTAGDGGDILRGNSGNDSITGNNGPDTIQGDGGNDVMLEGGAGADAISGGTGNDTLSGGTGADVLSGNAGADNLTGGTGNDSFNYTAVTDSQTSAVDTITDFTQSSLSAAGALVTEGDNIRLTFTMGNSDDIMTFSDKGDETQGLVTSLLAGNVKGDFAFATDINTLFIDMDGDGTLNADDYKIKITGLTTFHDDDLDLYVTVGTGGDTFTGADGDDSITSNSGADSLYGDGGNDTITAATNNGANKIFGGPGNDSLVGGSAADSIIGGSTTTDTATGSSGNDTISSGAGGDTVYGGEGADSITGGAGADSIYGQLGNDTIVSAAGADSVQGNEGNDSITDAAGASSLQGGAGNDTITCGAGVDTMDGGAGNDTFDVSDVTVLANRAVISDFVSGSDVIKLAAANTTDGTAAGSAPVMGKSDTASPVANSAYVPSVSTTANDIIELQTASLANAGNATLGSAGDLSAPSEELFEAMAAAGANNEISQITATTAGDKFYIVAYDANDIFIYYADAGAGDTAVLKTEVNLVASITGTGNFAVDVLEASDFILG